jgi:hypothetical protein
MCYHTSPPCVHVLISAFHTSTDMHAGSLPGHVTGNPERRERTPSLAAALWFYHSLCTPQIPSGVMARRQGLNLVTAVLFAAFFFAALHNSVVASGDVLHRYGRRLSNADCRITSGECPVGSLSAEKDCQKNGLTLQYARKCGSDVPVGSPIRFCGTKACTKPIVWYKDGSIKSGGVEPCSGGSVNPLTDACEVTYNCPADGACTVASVKPTGCKFDQSGGHTPNCITVTRSGNCWTINLTGTCTTWPSGTTLSHVSSACDACTTTTPTTTPCFTCPEGKTPACVDEPQQTCTGSACGSYSCAA